MQIYLRVLAQALSDYEEIYNFGDLPLLEVATLSPLSPEFTGKTGHPEKNYLRIHTDIWGKENIGTYAYL